MPKEKPERENKIGMQYYERPLSSPIDETALSLIEACIVREWSRISLRLRLCLKELGIAEDPFALPSRGQIDRWSSELRKRLGTSASKNKLEKTIRHLRLMLECRNAISHGECRWAREDDSYLLWYTSAKAAHIHLPKSKTLGQPPPLEVLSGIALMPENSRTDSYSFAELRKHADDIMNLTRNVVELSEEVLGPVRTPFPQTVSQNRFRKWLRGIWR